MKAVILEKVGKYALVDKPIRALLFSSSVLS
jgi:hypothetical protein